MSDDAQWPAEDRPEDDDENARLAVGFEIEQLIEELLRLAEGQPALYVCANAEHPDYRHRILYLRQEEERLCPDCGQPSLSEFVIRDAPAVAAMDAREARDISLFMHDLYDRIVTLGATNPVLVKCPHTGLESAYRCNLQQQHRTYYAGKRVGDACPACYHTTLQTYP